MIKTVLYLVGFIVWWEFMAAPVHKYWKENVKSQFCVRHLSFSGERTLKVYIEWREREENYFGVISNIQHQTTDWISWQNGHHDPWVSYDNLPLHHHSTHIRFTMYLLGSSLPRAEMYFWTSYLLLLSCLLTFIHELFGFTQADKIRLSLLHHANVMKCQM